MSKEQFNQPEEKEKKDPASTESAWENESNLEKVDEFGRPKKKLPPKKFGEWPKAA